ncbi:DUF1552 domain-containing protein [Gammaproteobacteria bacterium]|nr:DUF1552 domain-containing protein [Gammaproteobacteria bacterium]
MVSYITKKHLSRRTFLRGTGTTLTLPFLESMLPAGTALAQGALPKTRFGAIYTPHGATMSRWTPATTGKNFEFTEILKPLEAFRERVNVISGLGLPLAYGPGGATANHNRSAATFLSGAKPQSGASPMLGVTIDQMIAQHLHQDTPLPSLELTIEEATLSCGEGLSCAYRNTISWQSDVSPLPMQNNPQVVFEHLFGDGATPELREARRKQSLSLLDAISDQLSSLNRSLPPGDKIRLEQFLTDIREIERRIVQAGEKMSDDIAVPDKPNGIPSDVDEHIKLMYDLQVLAWQTEISRVSTFLMAKELSGAVYPASGVRDGFHTLSHHSQNEEQKARFAVLNRYHVGLLAYFMDKLKSTPDGDGSLLDNSMILYGSGMSDGNSHNHDPLPVILAGGASGRLEGNRHIMNPDKTTMSNLLVSMLHLLDIEQESFGDSDGYVTL